MQIPGATIMTEECAWKYQMQKQEYDKYPMYAQNPHEYMKEFYSKECQRIEVNENKLMTCLNKNQWYRQIGVGQRNNIAEVKQAYSFYCDNTFDPIDGATDRFICNVLTGNQKYN
jgi:hypothetical protein